MVVATIDVYRRTLFVAYCWTCHLILEPPYGSLRCSRCGAASGRKYQISLTSRRIRAAINPANPSEILLYTPVPVDLKATIKNAGEKKPSFISEAKSSKSADGSTAIVYTEYDKRDPNKQNRRRRKKVTLADGTVAKNIDVPLGDIGHGNVGEMIYPPAPPIEGDPMMMRVSIKQPPRAR